MSVDDFLRNDLILKTSPPLLKWNRQIKKHNTRLFTGTHCEYLGTVMYRDFTVVQNKHSVPV